MKAWLRKNRGVPLSPHLSLGEKVGRIFKAVKSYNDKPILLHALRCVWKKNGNG